MKFVLIRQYLWLFTDIFVWIFISLAISLTFAFSLFISQWKKAQRKKVKDKKLLSTKSLLFAICSHPRSFSGRTFCGQCCSWCEVWVFEQEVWGRQDFSYQFQKTLDMSKNGTQNDQNVWQTAMGFPIMLSLTELGDLQSLIIGLLTFI